MSIKELLGKHLSNALDEIIGVLKPAMTQLGFTTFKGVWYGVLGTGNTDPMFINEETEEQLAVLIRLLDPSPVVLVYKNGNWDHLSLGFDGAGEEITSTDESILTRQILDYVTECRAAIEEEESKKD